MLIPKPGKGGELELIKKKTASITDRKLDKISQ